MSQKIDSLDIREFLSMLRKHSKFIGLITLMCGLTAYGISRWALKPQYEADAVVIVNTEQASASDITHDQITAAQQLVNTYSIILKSDPVLDQVIQNLDLPMKADRLARQIEVKGVDDTEVIDITVRDSDPQMAADIANEITYIAPSAIVSTVKAGSVGVISPAKRTEAPVSPNSAVNAGIALLAGFLTTVAVSIAREMLDNTFDSGKDIQKYLDCPVLGVIPNVKGRQFQIR